MTLNYDSLNLELNKYFKLNFAFYSENNNLFLLYFEPNVLDLKRNWQLTNQFHNKQIRRVNDAIAISQIDRIYRASKSFLDKKLITQKDKLVLYNHKKEKNNTSIRIEEIIRNSDLLYKGLGKRFVRTLQSTQNQIESIEIQGANEELQKYWNKI